MSTIRTTLAAAMLAAACTPAPAQGLQDRPMITRCAEAKGIYRSLVSRGFEPRWIMQSTTQDGSIHTLWATKPNDRWVVLSGAPKATTTCIVVAGNEAAKIIAKPDGTWDVAGGTQ